MITSTDDVFIVDENHLNSEKQAKRAHVFPAHAIILLVFPDFGSSRASLGSYLLLEEPHHARGSSVRA